MGNKQPKEEEKAAPAPSLQDASANLEGKVAQLEEKIKKCEADAKQWIAKQATQPSAKARAMQSLKMKKMYEQQKDQLVGTQFNVQNLAMQQEQAEITATAVSAMQQATAELKKQQEKVNIDSVDKMMDQQAELTADMQDIQAALAQGTGMQLEEGLDDELAALYAEQQEEDVARILAAGGASSAPAPMPVPTADPAVAKAAPAGYAAAKAPAAPLPA